MDGYNIARQAQYPIHVWQPGDWLEIGTRGGLAGGGDHWDDVQFLAELCSPLTHDSAAPLRAFEPDKIGRSLGDSERDEVVEFVEKEMAEALMDTVFGAQSRQTGIRTRLRISGSADLCWTFDFNRQAVVREGSSEADHTVWVAERTFFRMMQSRILYAHTWGHWLADNFMLDSLFNQPHFFQRYAESLLKRPSDLNSYGL
jgi:hypothetical protein